MKKILAIIMMIMFAGCAQKVWQPKPVVCPPPPGPTQEQVLAEAKEKQEVEIFEEWWNTESQKFRTFLMSQLMVPLMIDTVDVTFGDDFKIALAHIRFISPVPQAEGEAYVIITRPDGEWNVAGLVAKNPQPSVPPATPEDDTRLETGDKQNEHEL